MSKIAEECVGCSFTKFVLGYRFSTVVFFNLNLSPNAFFILSPNWRGVSTSSDAEIPRINKPKPETEITVARNKARLASATPLFNLASISSIFFARIRRKDV